MDPINHKQFLKHPLLKGLTKDEIDSFLNQGHTIQLSKGAYLCKEGDEADALFFVLKGRLEAQKKDLKSQQIQSVAFFESGEIIGELSFLDRSPRSADVISLEQSDLLVIPFTALNIQEPSKSFLYKVFFFIAQNLSSRLRRSNEMGLNRQVEEYKKRIFLITCFLILVVTLCIYMYFLSIINTFQLQAYIPYFTLPTTLVFMAGLIFVTKKYQIPWNTFGITKVELKRSIFEGVLFTIPLMAAVGLAKWVAIELSWIPPSPLLEMVPWIQIFIYVFIVCPIQEFMARGGMQGILSQFITGAHKNLIAILVTSTVFSAGHLFISLQFAWIVFFASIYFGWLYYRTKNLAGVIIAHALLGTWSGLVLGW